MDILKEIPIGTAIKLATKKESIELSEILDSNGYRWYEGEKLTNVNYWHCNQQKTVYVIKTCKKVIYGNINSIYDFKDVLTLEEFKQKYMETNEIHIEVPEGMEIDRENSTFECIKFKPKSLTYEDVTKKLFEKKAYYIDSCGNVVYLADAMKYYTLNPNNATSKKQLEKLLAINKLMNVAKYLNANWIPDWNDVGEDKYYIRINVDNKNRLEIKAACCFCISFVYFKSGELTQQAIDILGEDTVRLACSTDW